MSEEKSAPEAPPIGEAQTEPAESGCPMHIRPPVEGGGNQQWWPDKLNLRVLAHNPQVIRPREPDFDYDAALADLCLLYTSDAADERIV